MKKLTAGIFATLLAVVSVGAAHAEIASKGYVDQQVGTKADAATVSSLQGTVSGHTSQIGTINDTIGGYGDIVTHDASEFATSAQGAKADTAVQPAAIANVERTINKTTTLSAESTDAQYPSAKAVYDTIQAETEGIASSGDLQALGTRVTTAEGEIDTLQTQMAGKANTADLGDLATLDAVGSAQITDGSVATGDIADKAVTEAKLSDTVNASLDKADTALQAADLADYVTKEAADAAYADIATEGVASTASTNAQTALTNIGTLTNLTTEAKTNTVAAINEVASEAAAAASAASAADTKAGQAQTAATTAQGEVDALEAVVNNETTGLAAAHTAIDALESGKLDKTGTAARATADASGNEITKTYATKAEIADLATDENLALKQDKTDNSLATTNKTVVGAINEVKTQADKGVSDAATAKSAADAAQQTASQAQQTANAAIPAPTAACADPDNKCVLVSSGAGNYSWEVIARGSAE